jgi:hypothetical protein
MISRFTIIRAAIGRFIPGVLAFLGCGLYVTARMKGLTLGPPQIEGVTILTLFMALGFVIGVSVVRRVLPRAAGVDGRRSLFAGFVSPVVLLALEMMRGGPISHRLSYGLAVVAGSAVSLAVFVPRIGRRAPARAEYEAAGGNEDDESVSLLLVHS